MYKRIDPEEPIRQGDIFRWLPKAELVLGEANLPLLTVSEKAGERPINWLQWVQSQNDNLLTVVSVKSVYGIVITQDCDASREDNIAFAEIVPLKKFFQSYKEGNAKSFIDLVKEQSRKNQKWYYMAENSEIGFNVKMVANLLSVFEVRREMLDTYRDPLRLARLDDDVAWPHFRERVAEFFRRYPFNEWYPFSSDEVTAYEGGKIIVDRYPWQK